jgi:hypothetical protein
VIKEIASIHAQLRRKIAAVRANLSLGFRFRSRAYLLCGGVFMPSTDVGIWLRWSWKPYARKAMKPAKPAITKTWARDTFWMG